LGNLLREKRFSLRVCCGILIILTGCASVGPRYSEEAEINPYKARIFIYRPHPPIDILLNNTYAYVHAPDIYQEDQKLTGLNVNAYTYVDIEPGITVFSARDKLTGGSLADIEINAGAGQQYYLRYLFNFGVMTMEISFKIIPQAIAREEIRKTRYTPSLQK
jgi:hypothetical protein